MSRFTPEEKLTAIRRHIEDHESYNSIAESIGANKTDIIDWCRNYMVFGEEHFYGAIHKRHYSLEFKCSAVEYYLCSKGSLRETCAVFSIPDKGVLMQWIKAYNSHKLNASPGTDGGVRSMAKGRKTTLEERLAIVEDHIKNGSNYAETARKFNVSYGQVYQWAQKYRKKGVDGLRDNRGRTKPESEMTEIEKLQAENRMLKAQLEYKELENMFLKKVEEIERRRS